MTKFNEIKKKKASLIENFSKKTNKNQRKIIPLRKFF